MDFIQTYLTVFVPPLYWLVVCEDNLLYALKVKNITHIIPLEMFAGHFNYFLNCQYEKKHIHFKNQNICKLRSPQYARTAIWVCGLTTKSTRLKH